jgi:hypothetical protein
MELKVSSRWEGQGADAQLIWNIEGKEVSDKALRSWCYQNMDYPSKHVDVVRRLHVEAWYKAHF